MGPAYHLANADMSLGPSWFNQHVMLRGQQKVDHMMRSDSGNLSGFSNVNWLVAPSSDSEEELNANALSGMTRPLYLWATSLAINGTLRDSIWTQPESRADFVPQIFGTDDGSTSECGAEKDGEESVLLGDK